MCVQNVAVPDMKPAMCSLTFQQILLQFSKAGIRKTLIRDLVRKARDL